MKAIQQSVHLKVEMGYVNGFDRLVALQLSTASNN
jgi:hypothetical protein